MGSLGTWLQSIKGLTKFAQDASGVAVASTAKKNAKLSFKTYSLNSACCTVNNWGLRVCLAHCPVEQIRMRIKCVTGCVRDLLRVCDRIQVAELCHMLLSQRYTGM